MVRRRRGGTSLGCLLTTLLLVASGYFGMKVGNVYYNFYKFEDSMKQQIRFAETLTDRQIFDRLVAKADSLGLPEDARYVTVERVGRRITVGAEYTEVVELPLHVRRFHFMPRAERDF